MASSVPPPSERFYHNLYSKWMTLIPACIYLKHHLFCAPKGEDKTEMRMPMFILGHFFFIEKAGAMRGAQRN